MSVARRVGPPRALRMMTPLSLVAGAALLAGLAYRFAPELPALGRIRPAYALCYLVLAAGVITAHAWRWQLVARALDASLPLGRLIAARLAGEAVGALMPSVKIGGDPVRIALVYRDGLPGPAAGAGVALDRMVEVFGNSLAATLYVTVFVLTQNDTSTSALEVLASLLLLLLVLALLLALLWQGRRPFAPLYRWMPDGTQGRWRRIVAGIRATEDQLLHFFAAQPRTFFVGVTGSLLIEALVIIEYEALLRTFGVALPLPTLLVALVFSGLSRVVPTPVGLGALEAGQVAALAIAGETAAAGFLVGLIMRVHETLLTGTGLAVCVMQGFSLARLRLLAAGDEAIA